VRATGIVHGQQPLPLRSRIVTAGIAELDSANGAVRVQGDCPGPVMFTLLKLANCRAVTTSPPDHLVVSLQLPLASAVHVKVEAA